MHRLFDLVSVLAVHAALRDLPIWELQVVLCTHFPDFRLLGLCGLCCLQLFNLLESLDLVTQALHFT